MSQWLHSRVAEAAERQRVYFALSDLRPGQVKIGVSANLKQRMICGRMRLIASFPGYTGREAALHWVMRDLRVDGEWFRSEPKLWRAVIEAQDTGDLPWLPAEFEAHWTLTLPRKHILLARYGSCEAAAAALGCSPHTIRAPGPGVVAWARYLVECAQAEPALAAA